MAELSTFLTTRRRPEGEVETFASGGDVPRREVQMTTEDAAHLLLRLERRRPRRGRRSRRSARAARTPWRSRSTARTARWPGRSERNEELFLGHRDRPNEVLIKDASLMRPEGAAVSSYPPGHAEGFPDTFKQLYRAVYRAVEQGGMPDEPDFPTFATGHLENVDRRGDRRSAREGRWVTIDEEEAR